MPADILQFRPAQRHAPDAVVRVSSGGAVHHASLTLLEQHLAKPADDHSSARLVCCCTQRLDDPAMVLTAVSCSFCAPGAANMNDVTEDVIAGAIA